LTLKKLKEEALKAKSQRYAARTEKDALKEAVGLAAEPALMNDFLKTASILRSEI